MRAYTDSHGLRCAAPRSARVDLLMSALRTTQLTLAVLDERTARRVARSDGRVRAVLRLGEQAIVALMASSAGESGSESASESASESGSESGVRGVSSLRSLRLDFSANERVEAIVRDYLRRHRVDVGALSLSKALGVVDGVEALCGDVIDVRFHPEALQGLFLRRRILVGGLLVEGLLVGVGAGAGVGTEPRPRCALRDRALFSCARASSDSVLVALPITLCPRATSKPFSMQPSSFPSSLLLSLPLSLIVLGVVVRSREDWSNC